MIGGGDGEGEGNDDDDDKEEFRAQLKAMFIGTHNLLPTRLLLPY